MVRAGRETTYFAAAFPHAVISVVVDDQFPIDVQARSVVGSREEIPFAFRGDVKRRRKPQTDPVAFSQLRDVELDILSPADDVRLQAREAFQVGAFGIAPVVFHHDPAPARVIRRLVFFF